MSMYDLVMLVVFVGAILFGLWKGLAWQVASLAAIFVSYFVSINFRGQVAQFISAQEPWNQFAAMLILFLGTSLVVWTIFAMVKGRIREMELNGFDRQAGALVGAVKGALLCMVVTMFAVSLLGNTARNAIYTSRSGGYIVRGINELEAVVPTEIHKYIDPYIDNFNRNIVDVNGNFPQSQPILGFDPNQPVTTTAQDNSSNPSNTGGSWWPFGGSSQTTPNTTQQTGYQSPANQVPNGNGLPTSGQYSSGSYTQNPSQVPAYRGQWQTAPVQPQAVPQTNQQPGYGSYANGFPNGQANGQTTAQQPNQYRQPTTNGQFNSNFQSAAPQRPIVEVTPAQPPADSQTQTASGWPDANLRINSKDLLDRAIDSGRRALENSTQR